MKIALVHEYLTQLGGAERVLSTFAKMWPAAPIYTLYTGSKEITDEYTGHKIYTSFIQRLPAPPPAGRKWWLMLQPMAIERFNFDNYDVVLTDSSSFSKGIRTNNKTTHICYLHTPTRYLWQVTNEYIKESPAPKVLKPILPPFMKLLKKWDFEAAQRPDYLIANSETVAQRCQKFYQRKPDAVIFPPVDTEKFIPSKTRGDYWFTVGRQEYYKRTDLAVAAATKLGLKLKVAGSGSNIEQLKKTAGPTVEFLGRVSDEELAKLYAESIGLIFTAEEDAGIVPLEAMAAGRPVIAFGKGGALESVVPGLTGEFFEEQNVDSLVKALSEFDTDRYDSDKIREHAKRFDIKEFEKKILKAINEAQAKKKA